jgi:tRNA(Ile)-lysidine synthase
MAATDQQLARSLAAAPRSTSVCVAFSGGLDSTVLLHALAQRRHDGLLGGLRALHVNHGLQSASGDWGRQCARFCARLDVPIELLSAGRIDASRGGSEAAAREARYAALEAKLRPGEWLATAHHQDDQAETVLLRLLRGSGPAGLSAIRPLNEFGAGFLWRPLLDLPRAALREYAHSAGLEWCEDPSNRDTAFERNYLRALVMPRLRERWPAASASLARSAALCRESLELLDELAAIDLAAAGPDGRLSVDGLAQLAPARARNLLRYYLRRAGWQVPGASALEEGLRQLLYAREDTAPRLVFPGGELRRYRGCIYPVPGDCASNGETSLNWDGRERLELLRGGLLSFTQQDDGGLDPAILERPLTVRYRRGGERLRRPGQRHRQSLKKLLQAAGIPPWMRSRIPLLFSDDELLAVGELWISADASAPAGTPGLRLQWRSNPPLR